MAQLIKRGIPLRQQIDEALKPGRESWRDVMAVTVTKAGKMNTIEPEEGLAILQAVDKGQIEKDVTDIWVSTRNANVRICAANGSPLDSTSEWQIASDYVPQGD